MLTILDELPLGLLQADARDLHRFLDGPTLIHLPGRRTEPLFVSVLLHGNEDTGWLALRALLKKYAGRRLPRSLSIFIGNIMAARHGLRRLDGQVDYNRIWNGGAMPEHAMMAQVIDEMRARHIFASIDIHNNTGLNPHYACVNRLEQRYLQFAVLFSRIVVYFVKPEGVQATAFGKLCPAVTVECGQPGLPHGVEHALQYLDACLNLSAIPDHPVACGDIDLFHTVAIIKVPEEIGFSFGDDMTDIRFPRDLDRMNFTELPANTVLGRIHAGSGARLEAWNEQGVDIGERYFHYANDEIRLLKPVMTSMLSCDERIVRQDCLCYLMERMTAGS